MSINLIEEIRKRTMRYYYEDGLVEIAVGFQFFVIGAVLWVVEDWFDGAAFALVMSVGLFLLIWSGARGVKLMVGRLKRGITYPRTGEVEYGGQADPRRWRFVIAMALIVLVNFFLPEGLIDIPIMIGIVLSVILLFLGFRVGLLRLQLTGLAPLFIGALTFSQTWSEIRGAGFVFLSSGFLMVLVGLIVFRRYLQKNPLQNGTS